MAQTRRVSRARAQQQRDSPRPRRRAAVRAAEAVADPQPRDAGGWTDATGQALVGSKINVWWPTDNEHYEAIVLSYLPRRRHHKLIYLADESVESVELGDGPDQRSFQRAEPPDDPLIGKDVVFLRDEDDEDGSPSWFDFMRGPREKKTTKFSVKLFAKLPDDTDSSEVCTPLPEPDDPRADAPHKYYRVLYIANEFLATVDLAHISYRVDGKDEDDGDMIDLVSPKRGQRSALPPDTRRATAKETEADNADADEGRDDDGKDAAYEPPAEDAESDEEGDDDGDTATGQKRPNVEELGDPENGKPNVKKEKPETDKRSKSQSAEAKAEERGVTKPKGADDAGVDIPEKDGKRVADAEENGKLESQHKKGDDTEMGQDADPGSALQEGAPAASAEPDDAPTENAGGVGGKPDEAMPDVDHAVDRVVDDDAGLGPLPGLDDEPDQPDMEYRPAGTKNAADEGDSATLADVKDSGSKAITVDREPQVERDPHSGMDVDRPTTMVKVNPDDSLRLSALKEDAGTGETPSGFKTKGEGSVGTQDTRDDPLDRGSTPKSKPKSRPPPPVPASLSPSKFDDEEENDVSKDEKPGPASAEQRRMGTRGGGSKSQVGDYISVDVGDGKERRKAFVEAYLVGSDEHFVAFCDSEGGNMQLKLTKENHTVLKDDEVDELTRRNIAVDEPEASAPPKPRGKRRRNAPSLTLNENKPKKRREAKTPEVRGEIAGSEISGRCLKIEWPGSDYVYTALVLGYNSKSGEHLVVYLSDHCIETVTLKYREWNLVPREDEPWIRQGMVGKRLYVFWEAEYTDDDKAQQRALKIFGEQTKVPYEAYVISYEGDGLYKVLYPATEDTEIRRLTADGLEDDDSFNKDWDILEQGIDDVAGLPVVTWSE